MQALLGIAVFLGICWLCSESRSAVPWRLVGAGLGLQLLLALLLTQVGWVADALGQLNHLVYAVENATLAGTQFLFGYLGGDTLPFEARENVATYLFAFRVLPQVVVFSAIVAVLWHIGFLPLLVRGFGWLLRRALRVSGVEGTAGAGSIFLGMVETPLLIRAYLVDLSRAQLFTVMTFGMSTVAGSVMVLYAVTLADVIPGVVGHLLGASVLNVLGAVYISRMLIPGESGALEQTSLKGDLHYESLIDALTRGTTDGLSLAMNVGAMLLVFVSMVALVNGILGVVDIAGEPLSLQKLLGWIFAPVAWLVGVPWVDAGAAGALLGTKLVLNELVAYLHLAETGASLEPHTRLLMMYALCGFANFGSLGILLGGLTMLVPERRTECLAIAPRSILSGSVVTLITAALISTVFTFNPF